VIATTSDDLVTLRERRRQLSDRVDDLHNQSMIIRDDIAVARQNWADAVQLGDDVELLNGRVRLRECEAQDNQRAAEHLAALLADVDRQIADVAARAQLDDDAAAYRVSLRSYAETLPNLPDSLPDAVQVISAALDALLGEVDGARDTHGQLSATATALRHRAEQIGADVDAPQPSSWSAGLERTHGKETVFWQLMLSVVQRRGPHAVLAEVERVIKIVPEDRRRAAR
jgi:hypothetical protein